MKWHPGWVFALWVGGVLVGAGLAIAVLEYPPLAFMFVIGLALSFAGFSAGE